MSEEETKPEHSEERLHWLKSVQEVNQSYTQAAQKIGHLRVQQATLADHAEEIMQEIKTYQKKMKTLSENEPKK